jgi:hypothetical protein
MERYEKIAAVVAHGTNRLRLEGNTNQIVRISSDIRNIIECIERGDSKLLGSALTVT